MKTQRVGIGILAVFLIGIGIFAQATIQNEQRARAQDIRHKGNYLVSLIALHPMKDFHSGKRDFIIKTLAQYVTADGLIYCIVHDQAGTPLLSLARSEVAAKIPADIEKNSLYVNGYIQQTYTMDGSNDVVNEFAKAIFENGERSGTVRMGFNLPPISLLSPERIKLMGIMAFFAFAMAVLVYYGITLALRPLHQVNQNFQNFCVDTIPESTSPVKNGGVHDMIENLEHSVGQLKDKYERMQAENVNLSTKCGVIAFEKNNVFNIIDSINYGIIVTDVQDNITYINSYMLSLLEMNSVDVIDRPLGEVLGHDEITAFILQQDVLSKSSNVSYIEGSFPEIAGGEFFQVALSYLEGKEEDVIGKIISFKNISRQKASEKAKHEFISHITHELLTPLTTINSYNEMLMEDEVENLELQKEFYNTISEETNRLTRLVKTLLNISQIEMGSLSLNKDLVKSDWLFNDCLTAVEGAAQKKNITIERNLPDHFPSLFGDKELLKVGVINILGNAVKYTAENGQIKFSLTEQDEVAVIEVIDTGYGISKEDLPHVFDKFYRSADPRVTDQTGSGLGLALTAEIVRLHGGEIEVSSKPDEGSHFTIRLPREEYYLGKQ